MSLIRVLFFKEDSRKKNLSTIRFIWIYQNPALDGRVKMANNLFLNLTKFNLYQRIKGQR